MFRNRYKYISTGMSSTATDLDGLRRLMALVTSESETDAEGKKSEDDKRIVIC
jgi:hypothetical protein